MDVLRELDTVLPLPVSPSGHLLYCKNNKQTNKKNMLTIDHHYKRDICKTRKRKCSETKCRLKLVKLGRDK